MQHPEQREAVPKSACSRSKVVRDTFVFQLKLMLDGGRDLFLSPVSMLAALAGILLHPSNPERYLRKLMYFGHKTDRWINLFGAYRQGAADRQTRSDFYVKKVEESVVKDYRAGGVANVVKSGTGKLVETAQQEVGAVKSAIIKPPKS